MILHSKPFIQLGQKRDISPLKDSACGKMSSFSIFFSPVSVHVNLLNSFSAVAVTLCPVARCLWAGVVRYGENFLSVLNTFIRKRGREGEKNGGWGEIKRERMVEREREKEGEKGRVEEREREVCWFTLSSSRYLDGCRMDLHDLQCCNALS